MKTSLQLTTIIPAALLRFATLLLTVFAPLSALQAQSTYTTPYTFTTLAGIAANGSADGTGSAARFFLPDGVAVDSAGNSYVADTYNHTIRKITAAGVVTTLAGTANTSGSTDGTGSAARFLFPTGMTVDTVGNIYVSDRGNSTIRKITPAGVVSTFAGSAGSYGSADGTGSAARFSYPDGLAADSGNNIYVADTDNYTIRKITPAGVVTTLAGTSGFSGSADGTGSAARFTLPHGVTADGSGNLYVADTYNQTIRKITPAGVVSTLAGLAGTIGSADGTGSAAQFRNPTSVAVDSTGNLYVADTKNSTIRKITPVGVVSTLAGLAGTTGSADGTGSAARFSYPKGVAVDNAGNILVANTSNSSIRKITPAGVVTTLAGPVVGGIGSADGTGSTAQFDTPFGVAVDSTGNSYVADTYNHTIRKITPAGLVTTLAGTADTKGSADGTGSAAQFSFPQGMAMGSSGNVYVADTGNSTIRLITPAGVVVTIAGIANSRGVTDGASTVARFYNPMGLTVDSVGNIYVADSSNHTIRKITPAGIVTTLAGSAGSYGWADGTGSAARFDYPEGVAVDGSGNVYVADTDNSTIRKITPAGVVTTLAGSAGSYGSTDGTGSAARFSYPEGLAVDSAGNIYVADTYSNTIRKITPVGIVSTLAGSVGSYGSTDGAGSNARFGYPTSLAVSSAGKVFVADTLNNTIRLGLDIPIPAIPNTTTATTVGTLFSYQITATNSPTSYTATGLPAGLSVNTTTGVISGTPTDVGIATVSLTATNTVGTSATATLTITISPSISPSSSSSSSSSSGGGGGGAPSDWFLIALALLGSVRAVRTGKIGPGKTP